MGQRLDHKLECSDCGKIYLKIPANVGSDSPIECSTCGKVLSRWAELEADFALQGGHNGVFRLDDGEIVKLDDGPKLAS